MARKPFPPDVLEQAQSVLSAWNQIGPTIPLGTLLPDNVTTDLEAAITLESQMASLELQITNARNERDAICGALWDKVKRVRAGVKANYGDDSSQWEMVGGTRLSERKTPARRTVSSAS